MKKSIESIPQEQTLVDSSRFYIGLGTASSCVESSGKAALNEMALPLSGYR